MQLRFAALASLPLLALSPAPAPPCTEQAVLPTPAHVLNLSNGDRFGWSVSAQGGRLAVGAPFKDNLRGSVFLFLWSGTDWIFHSELAPVELQDGDEFGTSVCLNGSTLAVGAQNANSGEGAAYLYEFDASGGYTYEQKLPSVLPANRFGRSVSVSDDVVAVGEVGEGHVYLYRDTGTTWSTEQVLTAPSPFNVSFGESVAIQGDTLVVGDDLYMPVPGRPGIVYVYRWDGATWDVALELRNPVSGTDAPHYGEAVALDGAWVVVGAPQHTKPHSGRVGTVWAFKFDAQGNLLVLQELTRAPALPETAVDLFGNALAIRGSRLLVGAPGLDGASNDTGSAYQYDLDGDIWKLSGEYDRDPLDETGSDMFGRSVALGQFAYIGTPNFGFTPGNVVVWEFCDPAP